MSAYSMLAAALFASAGLFSVAVIVRQLRADFHKMLAALAYEPIP